MVIYYVSLTHGHEYGDTDMDTEVRQFLKNKDTVIYLFIYLYLYIGIYFNVFRHKICLCLQFKLNKNKK